MVRKVMYGFKNFTDFTQALNEFRSRIGIIDDTEIVKTEDSLGRFSSKDIFSPLDLPDADRSVVDGYAVRSMDVSGASQNNPISLRIVGKVYADTFYDKKLNRNEAVEIFTGGKMPEGSDCVVMAEDCTRDGDELIVFKQCYSMQNVSRKGEDFARGDKVIGRGVRIKSFHIGALISLGIKNIDVYRVARVGVLSTGSELGKRVIDSTRPMIISAIRESGMIPIDMGTVPDDKDMIKEKILQYINECDMMVITGGTSIGEHDLVPDAVQEVAKPGIIVHGISMRPARTTGFAFHGKKPILMISGFPVAAYISFSIFFKEFLEAFYGSKLDPQPSVKGRITMRWPNQVGVRSFVRVVVKRSADGYLVDPLRLTGSGILSTLTKANGILIIDEKSEGFEEGDYVDVILTQPLEE